mgnify:CR=1 FL=1
MNDVIMAGKIGIATGVTMFASSSVNIEDGRVSLAVAVTCTVFICGIVWWLSSRFQSITDNQSEMNKRLTKIENELTAGNEADDRFN